MTQKSTQADLTDQLAANVRESWRQRHEDYYHCPCQGEEETCPYPKPPALVSYGQGQGSDAI